MTIQSISGGMWVPRQMSGIDNAPTFTNAATIDAANEKGGFVLRITAAGNISKILWGVRTVTTGATVDVRLETVDAATGLPTGTLWAANTNGAQVVNSTDDDTQFITTLTAAATVAVGDWVAVVISNPGASFGNMLIRAMQDESMDNAYCCQYVASWAKNDIGSPVVGFEYDDGSYPLIEGCWPLSNAATLTTYANSSTPDVRGLYFSLPFVARVKGWWGIIDLDGPADVKLIDSDGVTALLTSSLDPDIRVNTVSGLLSGCFSGTQVLSANTVYRLVLEPTSTTNIGLNELDVSAAAVMNALHGGSLFYHTSAKNPTGTGSWTNTTTKRPYLGLILDGFDDGAGGGGGLAANPLGGFVL